MTIVLVLLAVNFFRPIPNIVVDVHLPAVPATGGATVAWPSEGQAAIAANGYGSLGSHNDSTVIATASIAKVITALCVLEKHPLKLGEAGPSITMNRDDVDLYNAEVERNGSNVPVYEGETLTEYQMLQGMLVPSGNNMANSLAIWAFGNLGAYSAYANEYLARNGLTRTHIGTDASGLDATTTSTASDLTDVGQLALQNPVLMSIAGMKSITLPYAGELFNYNTALGRAGINGLKTGNNDQNKGGLLFTATVSVAGTPIQLSGAVLGSSTLAAAIAASESLVASTNANFVTTTYLQKGQPVGTAKAAWGASTPVAASDKLSLLHWKGQPLIERHTVHNISVNSGNEVGAVSVQAGETEASKALVLQHALQPPSFWWRLTRI